MNPDTPSSTGRGQDADLVVVHHVAVAFGASVERARSSKDIGDKAASPGARAVRGAKKSAPKKRARSGQAAEGRELMSLTKAKLYEKAAAAGIPGRSSMTHDQLADAGRGRRKT